MRQETGLLVLEEKLRFGPCLGDKHFPHFPSNRRLDQFRSPGRLTRQREAAQLPSGFGVGYGELALGVGETRKGLLLQVGCQVFWIAQILSYLRLCAWMSPSTPFAKGVWRFRVDRYRYETARPSWA